MDPLSPPPETRLLTTRSKTPCSSSRVSCMDAGIQTDGQGLGLPESRTFMSLSERLISPVTHVAQVFL